MAATIVEQDDKDEISENVVIPKNNNKHIIRDKVRELFINEIKLSELEAKDLEIGIFNATIDYANSLKIQLTWSCPLLIETYINISRSVFSNLKNDSYIKNSDLITRLNKRDFLPHNLAYMSCEDIFPERWKSIIEKQKLKFKAAYEIKQVSMSDSIRCSRCRNNKITYYETQCRSADEPMTTFYSCLTCSHRWKH
jgi:transcription elongation factor S-II